MHTKCTLLFQMVNGKPSVINALLHLCGLLCTPLQRYRVVHHQPTLCTRMHKWDLLLLEVGVTPDIFSIFGNSHGTCKKQTLFVHIWWVTMIYCVHFDQHLDPSTWCTVHRWCTMCCCPSRWTLLVQ